MCVLLSSFADIIVLVPIISKFSGFFTVSTFAVNFVESQFCLFSLISPICVNVVSDFKVRLDWCQLSCLSNVYEQVSCYAIRSHSNWMLRST